MCLVNFVRVVYAMCMGVRVDKMGDVRESSEAYLPSLISVACAVCEPIKTDLPPWTQSTGYPRMLVISSETRSSC